ncbi:MAG: hypothetical protein H6830_08260 [Planctomycetes bacterium]|nr:hypothetical protein [Planctomycetota bacterium]MCB9909733.1 hypothetical protein [Planctomycetota bacterium]MCB9911777.1 hypothetical protein [Planctomycetota bacterium]
MKRTTITSMAFLAPILILSGSAQEASQNAFGIPIPAGTASQQASTPSPLSGAPATSVVARDLGPAPDGALPETVGQRGPRPQAQPVDWSVGEPEPETGSAPPIGIYQDPNVVYDQQGDSIWSMGKNYKSQASPEGFTFVPFLGSSAPQNYPVRMHLESWSVGGESMGLDPKANVSRQGDLIVLDQGSVQVHYDMMLDQVEQSFMFQLGGIDREVVLSLGVQTELQPETQADGLAFGNALGGVHYTHALVYDAKGLQLNIPIAMVGDQIELRVPSDFMARATAPVVVDPIFATYGVDSANDKDLLHPDVAFDFSANVFAYTHTSVFSATDHDIRIETWDGLNDVFVNAVWVDYTTNDWYNQAIANDNVTSTFLVTALVEDLGGFREVWGRTVLATTLDLSPTFLIGNTATTGTTWTNVSVDCGGNFNSTSLFKVVWDRNFATLGYSSIRSATVTPTNPHSTSTAPSVSGTAAVTTGATHTDSLPHISKSTGEVGNAEWRLVYLQTDIASGTQSIQGARYSDTNVTLAAPTSLATISSLYSIYQLDVSDGLVNIPGPFGGSPVYCMPVYYVGPNGSQVWIYALEDDTFYEEFLLTSREHEPATLAQAFASVASLSDRFVVSYQEFSGGTYRTNLSVLDMTNQNAFGVHERRLPLAVTGGTFSGNQPGTSSRYSGGFTSSRYVAAAAEVFNGTNWDMAAVKTTSPDPQTTGVQYCIGNPNSTGDYGFITMHGAPTTTGAKLLRAGGLPLNQFAYFLAGQGGFGTLQPPGSSGLLCVTGGPIGRYNLGVEIQYTGTTGNVSLTVDPTALRGPTGNVAAVAGATWNFQAWHRENGGDSNFTDAISVLFE